MANKKTDARRLELTDGAELNVVFGQDEATKHEHASRSNSQRTKGLTDLSDCDTCGCQMVYPVDWSRAEAGNWRVTLRCPNCESVADGVFNEELIERYDCLLDRATDALVRDLRNLTYANMATEINAFVEALSGDHLLPEDF